MFIDIIFWITGGVLKLGAMLVAICLLGYAVMSAFMWVFNIV